MKKTTTPKGKQSKKSFANLKFVKDTSGGKTYDFESKPEFIGEFLRSEERDGKDDNGKKKKYTVNLFADANGDEVILPNNFQIAESLKKHGKVIYKFVYLGQKKLKQGRKVSLFDIFTAK